MPELIAVYDAAGRQVGAEDRATVYAEGLWHASAGVLIRSTDTNRVYVHRRTDTKMVFPGMHDCLAGGVLDPGEDPAAAAMRELSEELGITLGPDDDEPLPLAAAAWDGEWQGRPMRCHLFAYELRHDGPFRHQASEVAEAWWWTDAELRAHLADPAWPFVPDTRVFVDDLLR
ncbi:NUDIX domain-containing protein [Nocardia sp. 2]|uniref:NUDIX domain-containing protein n=1 Tax=Nocardia acididurans TaxID=2802282 RepID=A0ABS1LZM8_9NOCA|nr:NUDIX domain-containing protein [Nocardia acididurans]MBL1073873.1 NUDIX domain-containing protein [Nocardia acididurans]